MTNQASVILGPVLGGILIKFTNYETIFSITILLLSSPYSFKNTIYDARTKDTDKGMFTSIKEGILYVKESPFFQLSLFVALLNLFLIGPMQVGFPLLLKTFCMVIRSSLVT